MTRRFLSRAGANPIACFLFAATLAGAGLSGINAGHAGPALVVDLASGKVLHQEEATRPWYPASLTKLMTAYVALDAVRKRRLSLQTPLRVSVRASRMAPSKMGFRPGTEVTLENALKIIMVKSANDVSVSIAEGVSGSVEAFAAEMNSTARALGMYESHFVNPNGLHNPSHVSSARDMAVLARALFLHFPSQSDLYGIGAIRLGRKVMRNHNGLIGRYPGANGMKTGFVCASGFNVVASATRYGRTLITVILGAPNARIRTLQSIALLDKGFGGSGSGGAQFQVSSLPRSGYSGPPNMRGDICNRARRRELIRQYQITRAAPVAASATQYSNSNGDNAAAFFAADKRGRFAEPGEGIEITASLPPRAPVVPIPIYIGRAPGWNGPAAGPAPVREATPATAPAAADPASRTASRTAVPAGKPLSLRGAAAKDKAKDRKAGKGNRKRTPVSRSATRKTSLRKHSAAKKPASKKSASKKSASKNSARKKSASRRSSSKRSATTVSAKNKRNVARSSKVKARKAIRGRKAATAGKATKAKTAVNAKTAAKQFSRKR